MNRIYWVLTQGKLSSAESGMVLFPNLECCKVYLTKLRAPYTNETEKYKREVKIKQRYAFANECVVWKLEFPTKDLKFLNILIGWI